MKLKASTTAEVPVVVCYSAHISPAGVTKRGEKLRANDPRVLAAPSAFVDASLPPSEWPDPFESLYREAEAREAEAREVERLAFEEAAKLTPVKLGPVQVLRCVTEHAAKLADGRAAWIEKHSEAIATDPVTHSLPEAWKPR